MPKTETIAIIVLAVLLVAVGTFGFLEIRKLQQEQQALANSLAESNERFVKFAQSTSDSLTQLVKDLHLTRTTFNQTVENVKESLTELEQHSEEQLGLLRNESQERLKEIEQSITMNVRSTDFTSIIREAVKSVASIQTNTGLGSGVFVKEGGYIMTNYHVIRGASSAAVITADKERHAVQVVGFNEKADIAILKIEENYPALEFSRREPETGQRVIAIGNPGGLQFTVTEGIISATDRKDKEGNTYIQTDVPINPGNSGGPLVDASGKIIGINTLKISGFEGIGFALTAEQASEIMQEILG